MKKALALLIALALGAAVLTGCGGGDSTTTAPAQAQSVVETGTPEASDVDEGLYSQDVDMTNSTGVAIVEVYISQSDVDDWEEELLGGSSFADGATKMFTTDELGTENTTWDFLLIDEEGDALEFYGISLSAAVAMEFHWGDGYTPSVTVTNADGSEFTIEGVFEEEYYSQNLYITNMTGVSILEMYISPSEDDYWGDDLLEGREFADEETRPFITELVGTADATWDILIVDEDGDEVVFPDVNFSSITELTLTWGEDGQTPTAIYS